jgi:NHL repeat
MRRIPGVLSVIALTHFFLCQAAFAARIVLVAGGGQNANGGPAEQAKLNGPFGVDFDSHGKMLIIEMTGNKLWQMDGAILKRIAGNGEKGESGDGGPSERAQFNGPHSLITLGNDDVLVTDTWNNRVRRIDARTGLISTLAGTGEKGYSGDGGPAVTAKFGGIYCASVDAKGEYVYLADLDNRRIRKVSLKSGQASLVAGNGQKGLPKDGAEAISAPLIDPRAVTVDRKGNVYILERSGNALRVVDSSGRIRTVAGTGEKGSSGDGGEALKATMNGPKHLCIDLQDNVIIADTENHIIRKYIPATGRIVRVAGGGKRGTAGIGGPPEQAELNQPHGVTMDRNGILYISDSSNNRVLKIVE